MFKLHSFLRFLLCVSFALYGYAWSQTAPMWTSIGPPGGTLKALLADPVAPSNILYAGSDVNGVFVSLNGGATWSSANSGILVNPTGERLVNAFAASANTIFAAVNDGLYSSPAGGTPVWSPVKLPGVAGSLPCYDLLSIAGSALYLACSSDTVLHSLSLTAGANWVDTPIPATGGANKIASLSTVSGDIAVGTQDGVLFLADRSGGGLALWDSEMGLGTLGSAPRMLSGSIVSVAQPAFGAVSSSSVFLCNASGSVLQADLPFTVGTAVTWNPVTVNPAASSCNSLALVAASTAPTWILAMASNVGTYLSSEFANNVGSLSPAFPMLAAGPVLAKTNNVNAVLQANPGATTALLWATDFGLYSSSVSSLRSANGSPLTALNGPNSITTPSNRLNNVNVKDVAVLGSGTYVIAQSLSNTYSDVLLSQDGGANWVATNLPCATGLNICEIRSLAVDLIHQAVYVGTNQGVYYKTNAGLTTASAWTFLSTSPNYKVYAMVVGTQNLYLSLDDPAGWLLYLQPLSPSTGAPTGSAFVASGFATGFKVAALAVSAGTVYAGGGTPDTTTGSTPYTNSFYTAPDASPNSWTAFSGAFSNVALPSQITYMQVSAGKIFAGGDGFLKQCSLTACADVPGFPSASSVVNGLSDDGSLLYVGTGGDGLFAYNLASANAALVSYTGSAPKELQSNYVNSTRVFGTQLFVTSKMGLHRPEVCSDVGCSAPPITTPGGPTASGNGATSTPITWSGGGCSIGRVDQPDPMLWVLVVLALLQLLVSHRRSKKHGIAMKYKSVERLKQDMPL